MAQLQLLCNKGEFYPNLYTSKKGKIFDKIPIVESGIAPHNVDFTVSLKDLNYIPGKTYDIKVLYRSRGDGQSTTNNCSAIGYKSVWTINGSDNIELNDIITSKDAYAFCDGRFICKHYKISLPECSAISLESFSLIWSIDNDENKNDGQTLDLYYFSISSYNGLTLFSSGIYNSVYEFIRNNKIYISIPYTSKLNVPIQIGNNYPTSLDLGYTKGECLSNDNIQKLNYGDNVVKTENAYQLEISKPCYVKVYLVDNYIEKTDIVTYYNASYAKVGDKKIYIGQSDIRSFNYLTSSMGAMYLYINGKLVNSDNTCPIEGFWTDIGYCKPGTVITLRYCYNNTIYDYNGEYIKNYTEHTRGTFNLDFFKNKIDNGNTNFGKKYLAGSKDFVENNFGTAKEKHEGKIKVQIYNLESPETNEE